MTDPSAGQFVRGYPVQGWTGVISSQGILVACVKAPDRVKWFHTQCDFAPVNILKMSCCLCPAGITKYTCTCSTSIDFPIRGPPAWPYFPYWRPGGNLLPNFTLADPHFLYCRPGRILRKLWHHIYNMHGHYACCEMWLKVWWVSNLWGVREKHLSNVEGCNTFYSEFPL